MVYLFASLHVLLDETRRFGTLVTIDGLNCIELDRIDETRWDWIVERDGKERNGMG